ncbi:MAG: VanZ family protein [Elusimicrobia bacterium]|nr:VanZ family protein [Elusimicrobiota bacterium]
MVTIFLFSAQSAQDSSKLSGEIVDVVIKVMYPHYNNLPEEQQQQIKDKVTLVVRKLAHFTEFATLGFFLMLHLLSYKPYIKSFNIKLFIRVCISFIIGALYAFSDEIHQMFVTDRYSSIYDVMIDSSGVLFGIFLLLTILPMYLRRSRRCRSKL